MIAAAAAALTVAAALARDSLPRVTLAEALQRAARVDPGYVAALGQIDNAEWGRRSAISLFVLPSVSLSTSATRFSSPTFNLGTASLQQTSTSASIAASYDVFTGGAKLAGLRRAGADLETAEATELEVRLGTALLTESDYYAVLAEQELTRVAEERVRRATEQLAVARARVASGAAVQTDSLQLLLELTRARVELLREQANLRVARLQLGRRVGIAGPADAAPLDTLRAPELPISLDSAVREALALGPAYRAARAAARSAEAGLAAQRGAYFPRATLTAQSVAFGDDFFPSGIHRSALTLAVTLPLWDGAQREMGLTRARVARDVAVAQRDDRERAAYRDVAQAYDAYSTARASTDLAQQGLLVSRELFRVQEIRYRTGATTILDLIEAQTRLTESEAALVQARQATRLALAGLEAILGRRLFGVPEAGAR